MQCVHRILCRFENKTLIFPLTSHSIDKKARAEGGLGSRWQEQRVGWEVDGIPNLSAYPVALRILDRGAEHDWVKTIALL